MEKETNGKFCGCEGKRCEVWTFLEEKNTFNNQEGSDAYKVREGLHLDCNSKNLIYVISCKQCKKQYVGSCITKLRTRLIITAVVTGSFVGLILSFKFHFMLILC